MQYGRLPRHKRDSVAYASSWALRRGRKSRARDSPHDTASHTYVAADVASFSRGSIEAGLSYLAMDVCMFDPPPTVPDITLFLATGIEDARIDFTWSTPNANRSPLLGYVLEYSDCFLSNILILNASTYTKKKLFIFGLTQNGQFVRL